MYSLLFVILASTGCVKNSESVVEAAPAEEPNPAEEETRAEDPPQQALVTPEPHQFAYTLWQNLPQNENILVSPYSIQTALTMTYAGANGKTAQEMEYVLGVNANSHSTLSQNMKTYQQSGKPYTLHVANRIYHDHSLNIIPEFTDLMQSYYGAAFEPIDFTNETEQSRLEINQWVERETQDHIKDLLPVSSLTPLTKMVLVNALYFMADWKHPFDMRHTNQDGIFFSGGAVETPVPLMKQTKKFNYMKGDDFQAIELPYAGDELSMVVLLPEKKDGWIELEQKLSPVWIDEVLGSLHQTKVRLTFPKFTLEHETTMSDILEKMGMPSAFQNADFSKMSAFPQLHISQVYHKTFMMVDEKGTEAAAATGVVISARSMQRSERFIADHPFLFLIRHQNTKEILFMGRMVSPK